MDTIADLRQFGGADAYLRSCPSRDVLGVIGSKWTVLIVPALLDGPMRFGELRRRLDGITQKSLTQALRQLERDGFVARTQYATIPPRVEYALTPLGLRAAGLLGSIRDWAQDNLAEVLAARARFDARSDPDARPERPGPLWEPCVHGRGRAPQGRAGRRVERTVLPAAVERPRNLMPTS